MLRYIWIVPIAGSTGFTSLAISPLQRSDYAATSAYFYNTLVSLSQNSRFPVALSLRNHCPYHDAILLVSGGVLATRSSLCGIREPSS